LGDTVLVIEVADTTLRQDHGVKKRAYAQAAIPVYWIVNLKANTIEVYTDPTGSSKPDYRQCQEYGASDEIPVVIDGQEVGRVAVRELLP
jgi:Uma2 family endonuclease